MARHALTSLAIASALTAGAGAPALGYTLRIEVDGLRSGDGLLRAAVCSRDEFLQARCSHGGAAAAAAGAVTVADVPDGTWAVQVYHDEDADGALDRRGMRPLEGMGFSRDARMRFGPPRFADAAFGLSGDATVRLTMRYFQ